MDNQVIAFFIAGNPAPKGSLVAVQKGVYLESNRARLNPWLTAIRSVATGLQKDIGTLDGGLFVEVVFYLPRPKTVTRLVPNVKPDLDKLCRGLLDGLKGFISDDARVVRLNAVKIYADHHLPGAHVQIESLKNTELDTLAKSLRNL